MNHFIRFTVFLLVMILVPVGLSAQEGADDTDEKVVEEKAKEEALQIESLRDKKKDTLLYGIDSEVMDVLSTIRSENDSSFNKDLANVLAVNENTDINRAIFEFFGEIESPDGKEKAFQIIQNHLDDYDYNTNLLLSVISYLGAIKEESAGDLFYDMMKDHNTSLADAALRGIGKLEDDSRVEEILTLYEDHEGDKEYEDLMASAILVMGELGYQDASEIFQEVLLDDDAPKVHRNYAAISLGRLQTDTGFDVLKEQYFQLSDSNLRAYVLEGLTKYDKDELDSILITALRDSFWRIRVIASEGLGERQVKEAVDILEYKVKQDPVSKVRYSSLTALGEIGTNEANEFILEQFKKERNPYDIRKVCLDTMLEKRISGTVAALDEVFEDKWEKDKDSVLSAFCKTLSITKWDALKPFYVTMLGHKDFIIRIYGVRGIKINGLSSLRGLLVELDTEGQPVSLRREVKAALEEM